MPTRQSLARFDARELGDLVGGFEALAKNADDDIARAIMAAFEGDATSMERSLAAAGRPTDARIVHADGDIFIEAEDDGSEYGDELRRPNPVLRTAVPEDDRQRDLRLEEALMKALGG